MKPPAIGETVTYIWLREGAGNELLEDDIVLGRYCRYADVLLDRWGQRDALTRGAVNRQSMDALDSQSGRTSRTSSILDL